WNPRTGKGLLATMSGQKASELVKELLQEAETFFEKVEAACEELRRRQTSERASSSEEGWTAANVRQWTELRIRHPDLVPDNLTLPIQRLRQEVSELIKLSQDKDMGQELMECNRRLAELRGELAA